MKEESYLWRAGCECPLCWDTQGETFSKVTASFNDKFACVPVLLDLTGSNYCFGRYLLSPPPMEVLLMIKLVSTASMCKIQPQSGQQCPSGQRGSSEYWRPSAAPPVQSGVAQLLVCCRRVHAGKLDQTSFVAWISQETERIQKWAYLMVDGLLIFLPKIAGLRHPP